MRARRYSPLSHLSLVRSKTGPPRRMFLTSKRSTISARENFSATVCPVLWAGMPPPMRPRKLMHGLGEEAGLPVVDE